MLDFTNVIPRIGAEYPIKMTLENRAQFMRRCASLTVSGVVSTASIVGSPSPSSATASTHVEGDGKGDDSSKFPLRQAVRRRREKRPQAEAGGLRIIYDREVPFELRVQEATDGPQQVGTLEAIKVKVLILGEDAAPQSVRVELSSEADLFFHYGHSTDEATFQVMQEDQKLMVEFRNYPNVLIRMLNNCIKEPHSHLAVFVMQHDVNARLDFIQNMEYKFVELMSLQYARSPEDIVQHQITYRYNAMKSRLALMQARLQEVNNLVKLKNPSLLLQLHSR